MLIYFPCLVLYTWIGSISWGNMILPYPHCDKKCPWNYWKQDIFFSLFFPIWTFVTENPLKYVGCSLRIDFLYDTRILFLHVVLSSKCQELQFIMNFVSSLPHIWKCFCYRIGLSIIFGKSNICAKKKQRSEMRNGNTFSTARWMRKAIHNKIDLVNGKSQVRNV